MYFRFSQTAKAISLVILLGFLLTSSGCLFRKGKTYTELNQILEAGNIAFQDKQYDKAIELYNAGLRISPQELAFLNNKSSAMRMRAIELYNSSIRLTDKAKTDGVNAAKKDFSDASVVSSEAVKILKTKSDLALFILGKPETLKPQTLETHSENMRLLATIVDETKADDALTAMHEYIDVETDERKKLKAQLGAGKMLIDTFNGQKAFLEYKKILEGNPDNVDALLGVGLALTQSGQQDDLREAKTFLQKFVDKAPPDHPSVATAKEILASI